MLLVVHFVFSEQRSLLSVARQTIILLFELIFYTMKKVASNIHSNTMNGKTWCPSPERLALFFLPFDATKSAVIIPVEIVSRIFLNAHENWMLSLAFLQPFFAIEHNEMCTPTACVCSYGTCRLMVPTDTEMYFTHSFTSIERKQTDRIVARKCYCSRFTPNH